MCNLFVCPDCGCTRFLTQRAVIRDTNQVVVITECADENMDGCRWMRQCLEAVLEKVPAISGKCQSSESISIA